MLRDEGLHDRRHLVVVRQRQAVTHVVSDDGGRRLGLEFVVRIGPPGLVLHEVLRLLQLANIVVVAAHARQQAVGPDRVAGRLAEVCHGHRMGIRPRRLGSELPKQGPTGVGELEQREFGRVLCQGFEHRQQRGHQRRGSQSVEAAERASEPDVGPGPVEPEPNRESGHQVRGQDNGRRGERLVPPANGPHAHGRRDPAHEHDEQRRRAGVGRLRRNEDREHHGGHHGDAPSKQHGDHHGRERQGDELGAVGEPGADGCRA